MVNEVEKAEARAEQNVMQLEMIITGFLPILETQKKEKKDISIIMR